MRINLDVFLNVEESSKVGLKRSLIEKTGWVRASKEGFRLEAVYGNFKNRPLITEILISLCQ